MRIRSGPKRPAAEIGGGFRFVKFHVLILALTASWNSDCNFTKTPNLNLTLVVRRLQFHRNSGFFQANSSRLFWPPSSLGGHIWPHQWLCHCQIPLPSTFWDGYLGLLASFKLVRRRRRRLREATVPRPASWKPQVKIENLSARSSLKEV